MAGFMCDIVTPVAKLVSQEVELVVVPGVEGLSRIHLSEPTRP